MEWMLKYDVLEQYDIDVLDHPNEKILDGGGYIFLAKTSNGIMGSAGLRKENNTTYEVVKMAVTQFWQGKGISKLLMGTYIATAKAMGQKNYFYIPTAGSKPPSACTASMVLPMLTR